MIKVIVADDHAVLRQALSEMLTAHGKYYVVGQAASGEELLALLDKETPDVVIVDIQMPGMGGLAAIEKLQASPKSIPILVLSADEGSSNIRSALKAGAKGFVPKNAGIEELEFAIDSVVGGKTYLSPNVTSKLMTGDGTQIEADNPLSSLTERELEIFKYLANGSSNRDIAQKLHISIRTVDTHRSNILRKLDLRNNAELVKMAVQYKVISI